MSQPLYAHMSRDKRFALFEDSHLPKPGFWNRVFRSATKKVCWWLDNYVPCCSTGIDIEDYIDEEQLLKEVSCSARVTQRNRYTLESVHDAYYDSLFTTAPDQTIRFGTVGDVPVAAPIGTLQFGECEPVQVLEPALEGIAPDVVNVECEVKVSARIVSEVRMAVVVKVGELLDTAENRVLVDKVARKIMKDANFRDNVIFVHAPHVANAYFSCREHREKAGAGRRRCPKWLLRAMGFKTEGLASQ